MCWLMYHHTSKVQRKEKKDQTESNSRPTKKKVSCEPSSGWEGGGGEGETCEATQLKWLPQRVFIPGVHGKNPSRTAATASHGSSWKVLPGGGEANNLIVKKVNCSPAERQKAQEELRHGVWDISKYLTDFSIMKNLRPFFGEGWGFVFPPTTDPSHYHQAPWLARVIVWALRVQSKPFRSRSVCTDTM